MRLLREDLADGWGSPYPRRRLEEGDLGALHPLSELDHPIIRKALESIGDDPTADLVEGKIHSSTTLLLLEIRTSQWRGAIWRDPETDVHWLVAAGLAKGGHEDHDDFYKKVAQAENSGAIRTWVPNEQDLALLKQETAARLLTQWELDVQSLICDALSSICSGGTVRVPVPHPISSRGNLAEVTLQVAPIRDSDYQADEVEVTIDSVTSARGGDLEWRLTLRVLISIQPPEQGWDRLGDSYSNIAEPGAWTRRVQDLQATVSRGDLAQSEPGTHAHYTHKTHIAGSTINGTGLRGLCGVFFVPRQDHAAKPECPACAAVLAQMPA